MKQQVTGILAGILLICLTAGAQEGDWDAAIAAGKTAMDKHQYAEAEDYFRKALAAAGHFQHGEKDARFSATLLFLAQACDAQSKREEAETFARRSGDTMEKAMKAYEPTKAEDQYQESEVASAAFDKIADIFAAHQKYGDAEAFYQREIKLRAEAADEKDTHGLRGNEEFLRFWLQVAKDAKSKLAAAHEKLGSMYFAEHRYAEAAQKYEQALQIRENEADKRLLGQTLSNLATCDAAQGKYQQAEPLYQRALQVFEESNGLEKPESVSTMQLYALLLRKTGREEEARALLEKVSAIKQKTGQNAR